MCIRDSSYTNTNEKILISHSTTGAIAKIENDELKINNKSYKLVKLEKNPKEEE